MTFPQALQALCDEHQVKLMPGIEQRGNSVVAVLRAFKMIDGEEKNQVIPAINPKVPEPEPEPEPKPEKLRL